MVICTKKPNDNFTKIATVLNNIGLTYYELDKTSEALKYYMLAASVNEKTYGEEHVETARNYHNIGMAYLKQGGFEEGSSFLNKAMIVYVKKLGNEHPETKRTQNWLDYAKVKIGKSQGDIDNN